MVSKTRFLICLTFLTLACLAAALIWNDMAQAARTPVRLAPPIPCTQANRMDFFVDEDDIMYECECQMLMVGTLCAWQVIGGVESAEARRIIRRIKVKYHIRYVPQMKVFAL